MPTTPNQFRFSNWVQWEDRKDLPDIEYPGVYAIGVFTESTFNKKFDWQKEIGYFGMSCNKSKGIFSRLKQFDNTIIKPDGKGHSGARGFRYEYEEYGDLLKILFVSIASCGRRLYWNSSDDIRMMGEIAEFEYACLADYYDKHSNNLPKFNDPSTPKSPRS